MRFLPILLVALSATTPLAAQFDTTTVAGRVLQRRVSAMEVDSTLKGYVDQGVISYESGLDAANLFRMDDQAVLLFAHLLSRVIESTSPEECTQIMNSAGGGQDFWLLVGRTADSLEAEDWARLLTQMVWNQVEQRPAGTVATADDVQGVLVSLIQHSPAKEQEMVVKAAGRPDAGCLLTPWMMNRLVIKNSPRAAALIRGLMASGSSQD